MEQYENHSGTLNILLVDDDVDDCILFKEALTDINPDIHFSYGLNSLKFFDYVKDNAPDLIFLDVVMDPKGGIECLRELKSKPVFSSIPVIMFSVSDDEAVMEECWNTGADQYLVKPYVYHNLVSSLQRVLSKDWLHHPARTAEDFKMQPEYAVH